MALGQTPFASDLVLVIFLSNSTTKTTKKIIIMIDSLNRIIKKLTFFQLFCIKYVFLKTLASWAKYCYTHANAWIFQV